MRKVRFHIGIESCYLRLQSEFKQVNPAEHSTDEAHDEPEDLVAKGKNEKQRNKLKRK